MCTANGIERNQRLKVGEKLLVPGKDDKDGEEAAKQIDVLLDVCSFGGSGAMAVVDKQMRITGVYGMRKESDGEVLLSTMAALMKGAWYQSLLTAGELKGKVSVKRDNDVLLVNTTQGAPKNVPSAMAEVSFSPGRSPPVVAREGPGTSKVVQPAGRALAEAIAASRAAISRSGPSLTDQASAKTRSGRWPESNRVNAS